VGRCRSRQDRGDSPVTVLSRLQPFLCANCHSPKLKPVRGRDHTGPACPSAPLRAIIYTCQALGTWKATGCIPSGSCGLGCLSGLAAPTSLGGFSAKFLSPNGDAVHGSLHPSAPLASIPYCQLNLDDPHIKFAYGKGTGQCRPEPVARSAYLALWITRLGLARVAHMSSGTHTPRPALPT
jgi:hypothetical protein